MEIVNIFFLTYIKFRNMSNVYINPILSIREHAKEIENGTYSGLELARKFLTFNNDKSYLENCASAIAKDVFYCKKSE